MSVKYTVVANHDGDEYEIVKTKDLGEALRRFFEEAEEPYWAGDRSQVTLTFVGKGPKDKKLDS